MKIVHLKISNFLKLKDVEMNPTDANVIVGKNKQGKTSILKAIRAAFTGDADSTSIRVGESKAEIIVELDDLTIKRSITEKGSYLDIANKQGMKMPMPQKYLNGILGVFSFNPIEFFDKKPVDRKKYLLDAVKLTITQDELSEFTGEKLAGLDYEGSHALEIVSQARQYYYEKRTAANAEKAKKEKALQDLTESIPSDFDKEAVSDEKIAALRDAIAKDKENKIKCEAHVESIKQMEREEQEVKDQIAALQTRLTAIQDRIIEAQGVKFDFSDDMALAAAEDTLKVLESKRDVLFTVKRAEEVRAELTEAIGEAERLDVIVKRLTKEVPDALISKANLPIDGLSFDGDDILINGVNIDNLSSSEQLRFGLQIVRALNGEFKVICIDGIESLDVDSFSFFLKEIEDDEYQYFVTRVDGNTAHSIVVEDGEIKA